MTDEKLTAAMDEAHRFLVAARALRARRAKADLYEFQGCRESGAVRRASLDLTRALANLRRPTA